MIIGDVVGLLGVGLAAGVVSTVVSLASIVSYPALLAFGLPPLTANVTNTVALAFTGVGAAAGSRPELAGAHRRMVRLGPIAALGGATGALLLLVTPATTFERIAPWLIAMASLLLVRPPSGGGRGEHGTLGRIALFVVTCYTGYFGAAGGFLLGGWVGPKIARRLPGHSLRYLAAACGLTVAIKLGWNAYTG
ncbi:sulfite exporter TauE/SafE family protein [Spongiactinospora sp. TRM90649]|uniref:sulfite exporter TauE/SafE family protein n=1 Tax=Spongiactinospora sp. TRM90649 TaxID=3031114 RepID=UPI0023F64B5C|nr:sulfite exporter TauE/SafE family protein [Spongiactinospora sp. TRM90649]MDF5755754.1 sulfite exporter TauE/SafE family protein [Spongiactinospora sp. TRM90649]